MDSVVLQDQALFAENQYGIEEPQGDDIVPPQAIDLIISPLLAFDLRGYRVGYGKGYYDRYFAACSPAMQKVGLSLFEPVEVISDTDPYDVPLDRVITAEATYTF